ncbi:MAG TPA: hypothetical protein VMV18_05340 [bacterium]|nr:hypothetical protein [bacterium]
MSTPFLRRVALASVLAAAAACASSAGNGASGSPTPTATPTGTATPTATPSPTGTPQGTSCVTDVSAGDHTFACDGINYDVHVPAACAAGGCPLVLDVHGLTMDAAMEDANTGMRALGDAHGYVVVQPNANPAPPLSSWNTSDYDKVFAFLGEAREAWAIPATKIHMTGFSQGGLMTFAFLCAHADVFASVAAGSVGGIGCSFSGSDMPSREIPVLQMHGTQDALISYSQVGIPQRDDMLAGWHMDGGTVIAGDANFTRTRYTNANGTVVEFISHDYTSPPAVLHGHCFPGSTDPGGAPGQLFSFACTGPNAFDWGEEAMAFFEAH